MIRRFRPGRYARLTWGSLMGPVPAPQGAAVTAAAGLAALVVGRRTARRRGTAVALVPAAVAFDLVGGLVSFQLPGTRGHYAGHDIGQRLAFAVAHVQPFALPLTGEGGWRRAWLRYTGAVAATAVLARAPLADGTRRGTANAIATVLTVVDFATDRSAQRWLGPVYVFKVIGGHGSLPQPQPFAA